jgi:hypothetical protein
MIRKLVTSLVLLVAAAVSAEELTVDKVLAAHSFGAPPEKIVEKINDPANTVAPLTTEGLAKLRAAGVSETVVQALVARAPQPTPTPVPLKPDDPRLELVAEAVNKGVSEAVLIEQIRNAPTGFNLTLNDLIYLKQSGVPESLVVALQAAKGVAGGKTPAGAAAGAPKDVTIEGLLLVKTSFMFKNRQGTLAFTGNDITWTDAADSAQSFTVKATALERAWLKCRPLPAGNFCYELGFSMFKGDDYSFLDSGEPQGSNDNVLALRAAIAARYPKMVFEEKIKR